PTAATGKKRTVPRPGPKGVKGKNKRGRISKRSEHKKYGLGMGAGHCPSPKRYPDPSLKCGFATSKPGPLVYHHGQTGYRPFYSQGTSGNRPARFHAAYGHLKRGLKQYGH